MTKAIKSFVLFSRIMGANGYYTGNQYTFQGKKFAVFDTDIAKSRVYKSEKIAKNVKDKLNHCANVEGEVNKIVIKELGL